MSALILGIIDFFYLHLKKTCFYWFFCYNR